MFKGEIYYIYVKNEREKEMKWGIQLVNVEYLESNQQNYLK